MHSFRSTLRTDVLSRGIFLSSGSEVVAEMAGRAGFDWVMIDGEHGICDDRTMLHLLQAISGTTARAVVRVANHDPASIGRALDFGAQGIMVPHVETASQAKAIVSACQYAPHGFRGMSSSIRAGGYGFNFPEYFAERRQEVALILQIETPAGVANAAAIAATEGVDVLFLGPSDLTFAMGIHGQTDHPHFRQACDHVRDACRDHQRIAGIFLRKESGIQRVFAEGFSFIGVGSDLGILSAGMKAMLPH